MPGAPRFTPTTTGRTADRRSDFDSVYGDWDALRSSTSEFRRGEWGVSGRSVGSSALLAAENDPGNLSDEHALTLMTADGELLEQVCRLADDLRRETVGDDITYVVNRNINFTNVCYVGCRFCAFAQRRTDADAYSLSLDEVADRAQEAWELGANGCSLPNCGHVTGTISAVALSFIVHEPSGIIECVSDRSRDSSRRM